MPSKKTPPRRLIQFKEDPPESGDKSTLLRVVMSEAEDPLGLKPKPPPNPKQAKCLPTAARAFCMICKGPGGSITRTIDGERGRVHVRCLIDNFGLSAMSRSSLRTDQEEDG